jgi:hypothetical protein
MDDFDLEPPRWARDLTPEDRPAATIGLAQSATHRQSSLLPAAFLSKVTAEVISRLAAAGTRPESKSMGRLAKFWFGPVSSVHYEIWLHERTLQLELGLHCESTAEYNLALYNAFDKCLLEIQAALGPSFWLEEWDHGWVRLYETHPFWPLDAQRADELAERACEIIGTLQPILEDIMAVLPAPPSPAPERRYERHSRRR